MKYPVMFICCMVLAASNSLTGEKLNLQDEKDRISYSIGYQVGNDFKQQEIDIRPDVLIKGVQEALAESEPQMSPEEMRATLADLQKRLSAAMEQKRKEAAGKNLAEGNAYLAENARKEWVKTLPSGLQYSIISEGNGKTPGATDVVEVNYRGTLIGGTEFDSSFRQGKPSKFKVDKVIKGWAEALQLMKTGGKWRLFIPPKLAYGDRQMGEIGPNSTLIFDIELLAVNHDTKKTQMK